MCMKQYRSDPNIYIFIYYDEFRPGLSDSVQYMAKIFDIASKCRSGTGSKYHHLEQLILSCQDPLQEL